MRGESTITGVGRRDHGCTALLVRGLWAVLSLTACGPSRPASPRPSLLLITVDTLRADHLGCAGSATARTPRIDALAASGHYFVRAVSPLPLTLPSHASILTGLTPPEHGLYDNAPFALAPEARTLAEILREEGFATAAFVAGQPLAPGCGLEQGFERYDFPAALALPGALTLAERPASEVAGAAIEWLEQETVRPFFVWVHFFDPHRPYQPPADLAAAFARSPYDAEIAAVDRELGALLETTRRRAGPGGLLCVLTADHGEGLGEHGEQTHGYFVYESTLAVPLILAGPGVAPRAQPDPEPARLIDIVPTVLDLLGIDDAVRGRQGVDLLEDLAGPAYFESLYTHASFGWAQLTGVRDGSLKLIDDGRPHLFDLQDDPTEQHDLAHARPDDVGRMAAILARLRTASPLASGPLAVIPSAGYLSSAEPDRQIERLSPERNATLASPLEMAAVVGLFEQAIERISRGATTPALDLLEEARRRDPSNPAVLFWMARAVWTEAKKVRTDLDLWARAIGLFDAVRRRWPDRIDALNLAIQCRAAVGRFAEARDLGERAVREGRATAATEEILGAVYLEKRSYVTGLTNPIRNAHRGIELLEQARAARETPGLLQNLARAYREAQQPERARIIEERRRQRLEDARRAPSRSGRDGG